MFGIAKSALVATALVAASLATPSPAEARTFCAPRDNIKQILNKRFSEKRRAIGLASQTGLVELYVSTGGTWSMVRTNVEGVACIIATGHAWEQAPLSAHGPGT